MEVKDMHSAHLPVMIGIDEADAWTTASTSCRSETVFLMDVFLMDRVFFLATDAPPSLSRTSPVAALARMPTERIMM